MIDIEKLEELPFRENRAAYLTRKYGNMWNVMDYKRPTEKIKSPYRIAKIILKSNIGKSFKMAFHYYCTKVEKQYQDAFLKEFEDIRFNRYNNYYIDDNGNIQEYTEWKKSKKPIILYSEDYKLAEVHKDTLNTVDDFKDVYSKKIEIHKWTSPTLGEQVREYKLNDKYLYSIHKNGYKAIYPNDFIKIVVSGSFKEFESKQDREYKRLMAEKVKKSKKKHSKKTISETDFRTILRAKALKEKEATRIKLESKGMRPNAFTRIKTDVNV
jgi:sulfur relay (sulfurtransferase) DsrC/TusE family protein